MPALNQLGRKNDLCKNPMKQKNFKEFLQRDIKEANLLL
jgi:hypothetical protein